MSICLVKLVNFQCTKKLMFGLLNDFQAVSNLRASLPNHVQQEELDCVVEQLLDFHHCQLQHVYSQHLVGCFVTALLW